MIVDFRCYTLNPGQLGSFFNMYAAEGWPIQVKHLGKCIGYYQADIGVLNRVYHLWEYKDIADREQRRAAMAADPAWNAYLPKTGQLFQNQENRILKPAPFWPTKSTVSNPVGVVDLRMYTARSGKLAEFLKVYETMGLPIQSKHLGRCVGFFQSDIGTQSQIVHMWAYEDVADRQRRRMAMAADPGFQTYLAAATPLLQFMENTVITPTPFWEPRF